ncbi:MAG: hypothetical protein KatS3mg097_247 [Candidatus Parcubacteria bacterium]|nr:MAG: hypothetical protein KatS3mg097_247 [Candidatus Parcubacteria bacterium]
MRHNKFLHKLNVCFNNNSRAFTLVEILLYFLIFSFIIILIFNILNHFLKYYVDFYNKNSSAIEAKNIFFNMNNLAWQAKNLNILTDWEVIFDSRTTSNIIFLGQTARLNKSDNYFYGYLSNLSIGSISLKGGGFGVFASSSSNCSINNLTTVSSTYSLSGYAWSPNIGWIKFRSSPGESVVYGVCIDRNNEFRGFAWNDVIGWIAFNCQDLDVCSSTNFKITLDNLDLQGYAWNDVIGWLLVYKDKGRLYLAEANPEISSINLISNPGLIFRKFNWQFISSTVSGDIEIGKQNSDFFNYYNIILTNF